MVMVTDKYVYLQLQNTVWKQQACPYQKNTWRCWSPPAQPHIPTLVGFYSAQGPPDINGDWTGGNSNKTRFEGQAAEIQLEWLKPTDSLSMLRCHCFCLLSLTTSRKVLHKGYAVFLQFYCISVVLLKSSLISGEALKVQQYTRIERFLKY